jgi:hypothetical protein
LAKATLDIDKETFYSEILVPIYLDFYRMDPEDGEIDPENKYNPNKTVIDPFYL